MSELAVIDKDGNPQPIANGMPMRLVEMAISKGTDIDQLSKLMDMQERWESKQAAKSYLDAFSSFQSIVPTITKNKKGHNYQYAPLGDIAKQIQSSLQQCGLSYRFEIQDTGDNITVTCIVSHRDGHKESMSMTGEPDTSGSKNAIQSRGSTVTYLQRYCLVGALGLTTADADMDGRITHDTISAEQAENLKARLEATGSDVAKFCKAVGTPDIDAMPAQSYSRADAMLTKKESSNEAA